ncbi:MAG: ABC transporter substrate-binding protein, partial [Magnetococcales bacterium]|nr:ABC transporter substrate-binding protein [Magnetococcales bacterium]
MTKKKKFIWILAIIGLISLTGSLIIKKLFFSGKFEETFQIAFVAPLSGPQAKTGESMRRGIELFKEEFNKEGGMDGKGLVIQEWDDMDSQAGAQKAAREVVKNKEVVAVVGHWSQPALASAAQIYDEAAIPLITFSSTDSQLINRHSLLFDNLFGISKQSKFLANYTHNVLGKKIVTIIRDDSPYAEIASKGFTDTYKRFGTKIRYDHPFSASSPTLDQDLKAIIDILKEKKDAGTWFLAMRAPYAAKIVKMARDAKIKNQIVGLDSMATDTFKQNLFDKDADPVVNAQYSDKILVSAPLLYDTAGQKTQAFKNRYLKRYGVRPDWVASFAYESLQLITAGLKQAPNTTEKLGISESRQGIVDYLKGLNKPQNKFTGVTGATSFKPSGEGRKPVQIGVYNGSEIISSLTQLQPLSSGSPSNYFEEIKKG